VARFRANMAEHVGEPAWVELVQELSAVSPAFVELWERHDVAAGNSRVKRYLHPRAGLLRLVTTGLQLSDRPGVRLIVGTPADDESRTALATVAELGPWQVDWVLPEPVVAAMDPAAVVA
jgi:MmyB-like transcription regulator ligand binding domain